MNYTPRDLMINALERRAPIPGTKVPHIELVFYLTMQAIGQVHPEMRMFNPQTWRAMCEEERELHRTAIAKTYIDVAEKYDQNGFMIVGYPTYTMEELARLVNRIRDLSGDKYFITTTLDPTFAVPDGDGMVDFVYRIADEPEKLHAEAEQRLAETTEKMEYLAKNCALDGLFMCSDYCFNAGPFLSPAMMEEFIFPYLARFIKASRDCGLYTIKHTDGNIMPILDMMVQAGPHAIHSLDPQGGIDIAEIKRLVGDKVCLVGNVNCGLMQTGTDEEVLESCRYALKNGMPGGGYVYATSNCIFTGMPLNRYELMLKCRDEEGWY